MLTDDSMASDGKTTSKDVDWWIAMSEDDTTPADSWRYFSQDVDWWMAMSDDDQHQPTVDVISHKTSTGGWR